MSTNIENNHRTQEAAANSVTRSEEPHDAVDNQMMHIMGEINKTAQNLQSSVNKAAWFAREAAVMTMKMLYIQVVRRENEIDEAMAYKQRQMENYQLYQAVKSLGELESGEVEQCVAEMYCDSHDWITECIARWQVQTRPLVMSLESSRRSWIVLDRGTLLRMCSCRQEVEAFYEEHLLVQIYSRMEVGRRISELRSCKVGSKSESRHRKAWGVIKKINETS